MERWRECFHQKGKIYQQDVFSWCIPEKLRHLNVIFIKLHNTFNSLLARSIVFQCYSPSFCAVNLEQNIKNKSYDLHSLAICFMFDTVLICVSLTNCDLL